MKRVQRWVVRHHYISENLIWVWLAIAAMISAAVFFADPGAVSASSPIRRLAHPWDYAWNLGFGLGGATKLFGFFSGRPHFEALGMMLLTGALAVNFAAIVMLAGFVPASISYPVLVAAGVMRVLTLVSLAQLHANDERSGAR